MLGESSHPNVKIGAESLARVIHALVDEGPSSLNNISNLLMAHRTFSAAMQTFVKISSIHPQVFID